jgi:3-oxoacyl-[acyl-carrier protein] reductase
MQKKIKRVALITGASRGIGAAIAQRLSRNGICVLAPTHQQLDISSTRAIRKFLTGLKKPVDILVNNAGINVLGGIEELSDKAISRMMQVNLLAPLELIRGLAPAMARRGYGRILNISSIWSMVTKPRRVTYSMTKSGINGLTRTLAVELAAKNVLVNALAPGYVNTELTRQNNSSQEIEAIRKTIPVGRLAEPAEIAEVAGFLVSEKNTYITGQVIMVDGGFVCL